MIDYGEYKLLIDDAEYNGCNKYIANHINSELDRLVVTHSNIDHIGGLNDVLFPLM